MAVTLGSLALGVLSACEPTTEDDMGCTITGTAGADSLIGTSGDDIICPSGGQDVIDGGGGEDWVSFADIAEPVSANLGTGVVTTGSTTSSITGVENARGGSADDVLIGDEDGNSIDGGPGGDFIAGAGGPDSLFGADGADQIDGDQGEDSIAGGSGNDQLDGGSGVLGEVEIDSVDLSEAAASVTIDLELGVSQGQVEVGEDQISGFEAASGGAGNDVIIGSAGSDILTGGPGNDQVDGRDGDDKLGGGAGLDSMAGAGGDDLLECEGDGNSLDGGSGTDLIDCDAFPVGVSADLAIGSVQAVDNNDSGAVDQLAEVEGAIGSEFGDELVGTPLAEELIGGDGDDVISPAGGADELDGGGGIDQVSYEALTTSITVDFTDQTGSVDAGGATAATVDLERVIGGSGNDSFTGGAGVDDFVGGQGNDTFIADPIDFVDGGVGDDVLDFSPSPTGVTVNLARSTINDVPANMSLSNINTVIGSGFDDILIGGPGNERMLGMAGDDRLQGLQGNDVLNGGTGTDWVSYETAFGSIGATVNLATAAAQDTKMAGVDAISAFENIAGSNLADTFYGNNSANTIVANNGDDVVYGRGGNDTINGSEDSDTLYGETGADTLNGGNDSGTDTCDGGAGDGVADTWVYCEIKFNLP